MKLADHLAPIERRGTDISTRLVRLPVVSYRVHISGSARKRGKMKRFLVPVGIVIIILLGLAVLTEGSALVPFLYRNF